MKIKTLVFASLFSLPFLLSAQVGHRTELISTEAHFSVGLTYQSFEDLNAELTSLDLPMLSPYTTSFGYGGSVLLNKLVLGGQGSIYINKNTMPGGLYLNFLSGSGGVFAGYSLFRKKGTMIYPTMGFNYGGEQFHIASHSEDFILLGSQRFDSALKSRGQSGALSFELNFDTYRKPTSGPGLVVGLTMGYYHRLSPGHIRFEDEEGRLFRKMSFTNGGMFSAGLKIGLGTFSVQQ